MTVAMIAPIEAANIAKIAVKDMMSAPADVSPFELLRALVRHGVNP
jgi:hypothetical protein